MTDDQAIEIAEALLQGTDSSVPVIRAVARSLKALLPELGESWAVVQMQDSGDDKEPEPWLLSLLGELPTSLWVAFVIPAHDPKYEWPKLVVSRYGQLNWQLGTIADTLHRDKEGTERVLRTWQLEIGGEVFSLTTDEVVGSQPSREEEFARELADLAGWPVAAVQPESRV